MTYEFKTMSKERMEAFLAAPRNAVVATLRRDGTAQLSSVWYLYADDKLYVPIQVASVKYRNLMRDPRIGVCVDGGFPDLVAVTIEGNAQLVEGPREREMYFRICRRYYETDEACRAGDETFHSWGDASLVVVTPARIRTQDFGGWE